MEHTTNPALIRLPSAVLAVVALVAVACWLRHYRRLGVITVALTAVSSFALTYGRDARMYAGMATCGVLCAWAAWLWLRTRSRASLFGVSGALLVATLLHASGLVLAVGLFLVPGVDRARSAWAWRAAVAAPVVVWLVTWGGAFRHQAGNAPASWIPFSTPDYLLRVLNEIVDSYAVLRFLVVALVVAGGVLLARRDPVLGRLLVTCFVVPAGLIAALGVDHHLLLPRTLAFASWAPLLALAAVVDRALERGILLGAPAAALVAIVMLPSTVDAVRSPQPAPAAVLGRMADRAGRGDVVAVHPEWLGPLLRWHFGVARPGPEHPRPLAGVDADRLQLGDGAPTGREWLIEPTTYHLPTASFGTCARPFERDGYRLLCLQERTSVP